MNETINGGNYIILIIMFVVIFGAGFGTAFFLLQPGKSKLEQQYNSVTNNLQQAVLAQSRAEDRSEQLTKQLAEIKGRVEQSKTRITNSLRIIDGIGNDLNAAQGRVEESAKFLKQFNECISNLQQNSRAGD